MNNRAIWQVLVLFMMLAGAVTGQEATNSSDVYVQTAFDFDCKASDSSRQEWQWEGWQEAECKNGHFRGQADNKTDNTITSAELNINADRYKYLELYVRNEGVPLLTNLYFFTDNNTISKDKHVFTTISSAVVPLPQKQIIDMSNCPGWKGVVKKISLSFPSRSVGTIFTLYGLEFVEKPNYLYNGNLLLAGDNNLPLCWSVQQSDNVVITHVNPEASKTGKAEVVLAVAVGNGGKAIISTEMNHMHNEHYYCLKLNYLLKNEVSIVSKIVFLNQDGSVLEEVAAKFDKVSQSATATFQVPKSAYSGQVVLEATLSAGGELIIQNVQLYYLGSSFENWSASWIWLGETRERQPAYFFKKFEVFKSDLASAMLEATCDDGYRLFLNGHHICYSENWSQVDTANIMEQLKEGENIITVQGFNNSGTKAGLLCEIRLTDKDGKVRLITSDSSWEVTGDKPSGWPKTRIGSGQKVKVIGKAPCEPWSTLAYYTKVVPNRPTAEAEVFKKAVEKVKYSIDTSLGYPRMSANGEILTPLMFGGPWRVSSDAKSSYISACEGGFDIYRVFFEFGTAWQQDSFEVDCSSLDERIEELISINPGVKIVLLFRISAPSWWLKKYPDDACRFSDNKVDGYYGVLPSTSSQRWRIDVKKYLDSFIRHTESSCYSGRIIAYMPCSHSGPEWIVTTKPNHYPDYSVPMRFFFRKWLKEKYKEVEQLQEAWKSVAVTFETADIPARKLRDGEQYFLDRNNSQQVIDYNCCHNESVSTAMLDIQEHIKELSNNRCLNFAYYGYLFELAQLTIYPQVTGHYDFMRVLNSSLVEGLGSPTSYTYRQGGSVSGAVTAISSVSLHDKLWIQEADVRSNLTVDNFGNKSAYNMRDAIAQNIREFSYALTRRLGIWYFDMTGGWYDNPLFEKNFRRMHELYDWAIQRRISWHSPIAVLFDEKVLSRTSLLREHWGADNIKNMLGSFRYGLGRCGVPYDSYMLEDIYKINPNEYKCIIFVNAWQRDEKLKEYLDEKFRRAGNMIIWLYAPGYCGDTLSIENMKYMTGLTFRKMENVSLGYNLNRTHKLFAGSGFDGLEAGDNKFRPAVSFCVVDSDIEVLGRSIANGETVFGLHKGKNYSEVFMASPDNTGLVWRSLFESVGIKALIDRTDCVYYDGDFLGVHFIDGTGKRNIMPCEEVSAVWDVFSERQISGGPEGFAIEGEPGQSCLFLLIKDGKIPF